MDNINQILNKLPEKISRQIFTLPQEILDNLEEIRINVKNNIRILSQNREFILEPEEPITECDLEQMLNKLLDYSYYAYEEELAKGYITIEGGHRIGICGRAVLNDGKVSLLKEISSLNLRRSRAVEGAGEKILPYILCRKDGAPQNLLIVSPPKCGKTTLIRDLARLLSYSGCKVGICDERSEIAGVYLGAPSFDLGPRTDILDGCPKGEGMLMLIRAMSPDVIVTDEIGRQEEIAALESALCAGIAVLTTIHGNSYEDVLRSAVGPLAAKGIFPHIIFLSGSPATGTVREVLHV